MDTPQRPHASSLSPGKRKLFFFSGVWLALCCILLCLPPAVRADPASYGKAKETMARLERIPSQRQKREPWEKLAASFLRIYQTEKTWNNRPAALFRSARALDRLSRYAASRKDARRSVERYLELAQAHPRSVLADDALYNAARLRGEILGDREGARELLRRQIKDCPSGDMKQAAARYLATLSTSPAKSQSETARAKTKKIAPQSKSFRLAVRTVLIDPGHGGKDPGTHHNGIREKTVTLDISRRVGAILARRGLKVRYTRLSDTYVPLERRADKVRTNKADLFVSIHVNANPSAKVRGFETYYLDVSRTSSATRLAAVENALRDRGRATREKLPPSRLFRIQKQESRRLARSIHDTALKFVRKKNFRTADGGIKTAPFHVLRRSGVPGVLIEVGYCTNKDEAKRLATPSYRAALAEGIANGILSYTGKR